jgi:hypothetical protein
VTGWRRVSPGAGDLRPAADGDGEAVATGYGSQGDREAVGLGDASRARLTPGVGVELAAATGIGDCWRRCRSAQPRPRPVTTAAVMTRPPMSTRGSVSRSRERDIRRGGRGDDL